MSATQQWLIASGVVTVIFAVLWFILMKFAPDIDDRWANVSRPSRIWDDLTVVWVILLIATIVLWFITLFTWI